MSDKTNDILSATKTCTGHEENNNKAKKPSAALPKSTAGFIMREQVLKGKLEKQQTSC